jgi:hypothetical protein
VLLLGSDLPHLFRNGHDFFREKSKQKAEAIVIYFKEDFAGKTFWELPEGYLVLISYLNANRANLAEFAHMTLEQLTGLNLGKNPEFWKQLLTESKGFLKPIPLLEGLDG